MIPNNDKNLNYLNIQKNEQSFSLTKPIENKTSLNNLNANSNKMRFAENDEHKTLFSTFTGSTNMTKELKNSPLKKTHYNISEINSKYVSKDKNAVNFPISDVTLTKFNFPIFYFLSII